MADVTIKYKDAVIGVMDESGTKTVKTSGKYCEDDISVVYIDDGGGGGGEPYTGDYTVTPKVTAQTLGTQGKTMTDDLTIKAIPYAEVTNISNGKTVTIGNEV